MNSFFESGGLAVYEAWANTVCIGRYHLEEKHHKDPDEYLEFILKNAAKRVNMIVYNAKHLSAVHVYERKGKKFVLTQARCDIIPVQTEESKVSEEIENLVNTRQAAKDQIKLLEADVKLIDEKLKVLIPVGGHVDFYDIKCTHYDGKTTIAWICDDATKKGIQAKLMERGVLGQKEGADYIQCDAIKRA